MFFLLFAFSSKSQDAVRTLTNIQAGDYYIIDSIVVTGNKVTRLHIMLRELQYTENDTIRKEYLNNFITKSRENLLNTSLFNFVTIDYAVKENKKITLKINVVERWYTWPYPLFEIADRNFNVWLEEEDLSRTNYGFFLVRENFRGRKEVLKILVKLGYEEEYGFLYRIPYLNKNQKSGLNIGFSHSREHEIPYTELNNKPVFHKEEKHYSSVDYSAQVYYTYRYGIYSTHFLQLYYNNTKISDSLLAISNEYLYNNKTSREYLSLTYMYKRDCRDSKAYPLKGYYFDISLTHDGLGIVNDNKMDLTYIISSFRKYFNLSKRFYFANSLTAKISGDGYQPYYMQRALGYGNDFVRSYEYYVVDGQHFALYKSNFKFELLPPKIHKFNFIKTEKFNTIHYAFYLNIFGDAAYVWDEQYKYSNSFSNSILYGGGIGLDFVTYYDKVFRLEYSINKLGESAVFLHFVAPI
ncbi:MAG: POTRA domain-containing protein [Bacteroidales bacterium]|nr:POTRA domain-containing protein [Bacteroidales bacterium]